MTDAFEYHSTQSDEALTPQAMVREFHQTFGATVREYPDFLSPEDLRLRMSLINEEAREVCHALLDEDVEEAEYFANVAKELCDLLYVVYGAGVSMGLDLERAFKEVHRSNMSKLWDDGTVHHRADGKVLKPPTYSPADIQRVLDLI
jgi:predicted HAD superfamily Cof-like phosphohydrolase